MNEGLSEGSYNRVLKDVDGFLWIGSQLGLNRFDGFKMKNYFAESNNPRAIADHYILNLVEDSLHNIWIGHNRGITRYDIKADSFTNFRRIPSKQDPASFMIPFWSTRNEVICWDGYFDIVSYDIHSFVKKTLATIMPQDYISEGIPRDFSIYDSTANCLWLVKDADEKEPGGLIKLSLADGKKELFTWDCPRNIPHHQHGWEGMCYDRKRNSIWIASPDGLAEFSLNTRKFYFPEAFRSIVNQKDYGPWAGISIDSRGRIWIATIPRGISIYDPGNQTLTIPFPKNDSLQEITAKENLFLYCDRDNMVWTSSWNRNGINQLIPYTPTSHRYSPGVELAFNPIYHYGPAARFADGGRGQLWMSDFKGLNIFDPTNLSIKTLESKDLAGLKGQAIRPLHVDTLARKAFLAAGFPDALFEMDLDTRKCRNIPLRDELDQIVPVKLIVQSIPFNEGLIFCCAMPNNLWGFFYIQRDSLVARKIFTLPRCFIGGLGTDGDHRLFISAAQVLLSFTFTNQSGKWLQDHSPLDSINWGTFYFNKADQSIWVETQDEILHFNKQLQVLKTFSVKGVSGIGVPLSLIPDNQGNFWFNGMNGIARLDTGTGRIYSLSEKDGDENQSYYFPTPVAKDSRGDIYFSGDKGIVRVSPERFHNSYPPSTVYIRSIDINDQPYPIKTGIRNLEVLSLTHSQNNIKIEVGILDYYNKGKGQVRYKLEGMNENWQYVPNYYTLRFDVLPHGTYKLIIQAGNAVNDFIGPERILTIKISPPFWFTWWAYTLYALLAIAFVLGFAKYRSQNLKKQNINLERKVKERTDELKQSLEELTSTQTQLIQREKMASLGELTAGIAHEIQNPLNFVNNFSEVNKELIDEMELDIDNANFSDLKSIAHNIRENQLKITQHGKRADAIVKGMLQHSRSSTGVKEPTDISALADEYLRLSYHGLRAKDKSFNADFETMFDPSLKQINIIPQDIGRVMLNIYNNAFYAVHEKQKQLGDSFKPKVSVTTKFIPTSDGSTPQAEIRIRDNGIGIPQKVLDKIFQPFFTTKPTGEGTGLGLSLSYDIITKAHGGELKVDTREGEYSEFFIKLPIT